MGNIELKTYAGANVTPQNDAIMNDANTMNNGIYYGCNVTIKDATTLHITAGQGIIYGRVFEVVDSDISVSLSSSGTLLGQLFVRLDLGNISSPAEILVDTGASLTPLVDDDQNNIDAGITEMQLATFKVNTITLSDLAETFASVQPIRAVIGDADISAIGDGSVKGAIRTINTQLTTTTANCLVLTGVKVHKQLDMVVIDGVATNFCASGDTVIPSGYRPADDVYVTVLYTGGITVGTVHPNGTVTASTGGNNFTIVNGAWSTVS